MVAFGQLVLQLEYPDVFLLLFNVYFLGFSIVSGYFVFFLIFYGTGESERKVWNSLDWGERLFLGTLLGIFLLSIAQVSVGFISYLDRDVFIVPAPDTFLVWFVSSIVIVLLVFFARLKVQGAIHSPLGQQFMRRVKNALFNPMFFLPGILSYFLADSALYLYPVGGGSIAAFWRGLCGWLLTFVLFGLWLLGGVFYLLARVSPVPTLDDIANFFFSYLRRAITNRRLVKGVLLLALLAIFATFSDANLGIFTPRLDHIVTTYRPGYFITGSASNYRVLVAVETDYFIDSPTIWFIRNITIPNPSNYSYMPYLPYGSSCYNYNYGYYSGPPVFCGVIQSSVSDLNVQLVTVTNQSNSVQAFELILSPISGNHEVVLSTSYDDSIKVEPIIATYGVPAQNGVSSYRIINITLYDPLSEPLSTDQLQIGHYDRIINVSCARNGVPYICTNNSTELLWLMPQYLSPGQWMNFDLNVTYTGATYE